MAGLACALLLIAFVEVLPRERPRLAGTNSVPAKVSAGTIEAGQSACQTERVVPGGARKLTLGATSLGAPGPELEVRITSGGREVAHGRLPGNYPDRGIVTVPITPIADTVGSAHVCIRNVGPAALSLYGERTQSGTPLTTGGVGQQAAITLIWDGEEKSWAALVPTIVHHADVGGTQLFGSLTLWVPFGLVLLAGALALVVTLREADR